ncbi:MAG: PrsW family glutamic-type intramembrane protease [Bacillota bacterium]|nr:PrsW family glutamic-type intramembrane protease [Bacillota bacterium]HPZ54600.1 PrsW family glutamic-type intramembrane protease [Bacillota bacterium]HQD19028.1 PrsW family glutamic-type intramembrane protease [Bacillota bacterium]
MYPLLVLIVSFVPGLLWLLYFYRRDVYEPEPMHLVVRCFVFGILAVIPVGLVEAPFQRLIEQPSGIAEFLAVTIIVIGLTEETAKFLAAKLAVPDKTEIDEVVDGIVYCVSAGLGFSAAENYLYVVAFGLRVGLSRAVVTCLAHASFSGVVGYAYGRAVTGAENGHLVVAKGLGLAAVLHGLYDFALMSGWVSPVLLLVVIGALYAFLIGRIRHALTLSKFRR